MGMGCTLGIMAINMKVSGGNALSKVRAQTSLQTETSMLGNIKQENQMVKEYIHG